MDDIEAIVDAPHWEQAVDDGDREDPKHRRWWLNKEIDNNDGKKMSHLPKVINLYKVWL